MIYERADAKKPHMGLTTWADAPDGKIVKSDVSIAKNYLSEQALFLMADEREILQDAGKITAEIAKAKSETEFEKYRVIQDRLFMSDYDRYLLELEENAKK